MQPSDLQLSLAPQLGNPDVNRYMGMLRAVSGGKGAGAYKKGTGKTIAKLKDFDIQLWPPGKELGAYQFTREGFIEAAQALSLQSFDQREQDLAALYWMNKSGSLVDVALGDLVSAMQKDAPLWPGLPGANEDKRTKSAGDVAEALGIDRSMIDEIPPGPPELAEGEELIAGAAVRTESDEEAEIVRQIRESGASEQEQRRMLEIMGKLSDEQATEERLVGDDYPKMFDKQLRDIIDRA